MAVVVVAQRQRLQCFLMHLLLLLLVGFLILLLLLHLLLLPRGQSPSPRSWASLHRVSPPWRAFDRMGRQRRGSFNLSQKGYGKNVMKA